MGVLNAFRQMVRGSRPVEDETPCLALPLIVQKLKTTKPCAVLELGTAFGPNIDFYSSFSGKICVEDLPSQMIISKNAGVGAAAILDLTKAFQAQTATQFDLIMCWDILNYLPATDLRSLMTILSKLAKPGSLLFCQMAIRKSQPSSPTEHKIKNAGRSISQRQAGAVVTSPRYHKGQLRTLLAPFKRQHSYLMASGYEEYIFKFEGE